MAVPDGSAEYEVKTIITSGAGSYIQYLRASADALYLPEQGSYYSVEFLGTGVLQLYKRTAGIKQLLGSAASYLANGTAVRSVI